MSYAIHFSGNSEEIARKFDEERDKAAGFGMIEAEQRDIVEARDFAAWIARQYGEVHGSASGHWNTRGGVSEQTLEFGRISIIIEKGAAPQ